MTSCGSSLVRASISSNSKAPHLYGQLSRSKSAGWRYSGRWDNRRLSNGNPRKLLVISRSSSGDAFSRWPGYRGLRGLKFRIEKKTEELSEKDRLRSSVQRRMAQERERYHRFLEEEIQDEYAWERHMAKERQFWDNLLTWISFFSFSALWQIIVPVSFILGIVVPMVISWLWWDNGFLSPVAIPLYLVIPFKYGLISKWVWLI
uniref:Uncharacterized protein n=1 Tax=Tetraselmis sp. GSL018 TaxID=582737 RepID=A0A061QRG2_9CHLO|eukprot:CAMPEP_0177621410 /NCGR_PEP_ID=MMETSP0419_2-20121207/27571_1 /TAXON_ID=582737 /ORGANISM="Tetraselmis sp., Strain GSL018" /LENGTH=203 /DNA_ID=CAMNT_0019121327 /DNA_START=140 /DNA_END=751 /DNA_ORIENTATION=+